MNHEETDMSLPRPPELKLIEVGFTPARIPPGGPRAISPASAHSSAYRGPPPGRLLRLSAVDGLSGRPTFTQSR